MLNNIGEVTVRAKEEGSYIVKAIIVDYPGLTEVNLKLQQEELSQIGVYTLEQAKKELPLNKTFILNSISRHFPMYWEVDE